MGKRSWWFAMVMVLSMGSAAVAEDESPVAAAERMLDELAKQGRDVTAARAELEALRPEWTSIAARRDELERSVAAFRPKMEALFHKLQREGGGPKADSPIAGVERGLEMLAARGQDVQALRTELDALRPDWDAIAKGQEQLAQLPADQRGRAEQDLRARVDAFRTRMEALAKRVQALAASAR